MAAPRPAPGFPLRAIPFISRLAVSLVVVALLSIAASRFVLEFFATAPIDVADNLLRGGEAPGALSPEVSYRVLQATSGLWGGSPGMHLAQGQLALVLASDTAKGLTQSPSWIDAAIGHFRQLVRERPLSAQAWGYLALAQLKAGKAPQVTLSSYRRAVALDPFNSSLHRIYTYTGLALWPLLAPDDRERLVRIAGVAVTHDPEHTIRLFVRAFRESDLRPQLTPGSWEWGFLEGELLKRRQRRRSGASTP